MKRQSLALTLSLLIVFLTHAAAVTAEFDVQKDDGGVTVKLDGKLFTRYLVKSGNKPVLWPIIGPTGQEMTRQFPMKKGNPEEKPDHPHHRSLWFTHGDVNKLSYWHEGSGSHEIAHREFLKAEGGKQGLIVTRNDWVGMDGRPVCEDVRTLTFDADSKSRWIDFDIAIKAVADEVKFGDTKEGTFGVRVPGTMKLTAKKGGKIINSQGDIDGATWGKQAAWVDYHGPVGDQTLGVAILNHPSSFRYPTYWHVRTYGLFAANPFGLHNFKNSKDVDGSHTLKAGQTMTLRYRVIFHRGTEKEADIAKAFALYSKVNKDLK